MMRLLLAAGCTVAVIAADPTAELKAAFAKQLETIAASVDGVVGYTVLDLTSGDRFERLATEEFPTASTIKIAILYEMFRQADAGRLKLDEVKPLDTRHVVGGAGTLQHLTAPALSLRDHAILMMLQSDNTATNVVIDAVGAEAVTARMAALGLGRTRLRRRMMDLEAARLGRENLSSPADLARLLELIHRGDGLAAASRDAALEMMKKRKSTPLTRGIPDDVDAASKPGDLDGVRADAGIVYVPGRTYVFVMMGSWLSDEAACERAITDASRAAFRYFDRLAASNAAGRRVR
ncbi:MAG TPA: serine hydrolase [Vicinamibacterales bacterium]|jgi:beta-lactamase class A